jgi:signal transduction histidine kinase/DNA-binding NarL/FixJ family response regulator
VAPFLSALRRFIRSAWRTRQQRRAFALALVGGGSVAVYAFLYVVQLNFRIDSAVTNAKQSAQNLADVLAEHTARTFEALDRTLHEAAIIWRDQQIAQNPEAARAALLHLKQTQPAIIALGWTDAAGNLIAHTYPDDPPRRNVSDLPHFIAQRDATSDQFFISPPIRSAATGRWITAISRRLTNPDGSFAGVVVAPVDPEYFTAIYGALRLGNNGSVALVHSDATVMARVPSVPGAVGQSLANLPLFAEGHAPAARESVSPVDGVRRLFGYKVVPGLGMVVFVTYDRADVVGPVLQQARTFGPWIGAFLVMILVGIVFLVRQTREVESKSAILQTTFATMEQGVIVHTAQGALPVYNQRALDLIGFPESLMKSSHSAEALIDFQKRSGEFDNLTAEQLDEVKRRVHSNEPYHYERERPNGTVLEIRGVPMPNGGMLRTYTDITTRKATERMLQEAKLRAETAAQAKTDFLANMSHELRTPLTAILGVAELLLRGGQTDEQRRTYLEKQLWAGRGLLQLINDILDFSKIEAGQLALEAIPFSPHDKARACMNLVADEAARKGLSTAIEIADGVPQRVLGDPTRVRQVLTNLLSNAVKFTERGSVRLAVERAGETLRFSVIDTGIGIAAEKLPSLFERFSQGDSSTTRHYGGTGLGLAISKRLAELMGGEIGVSSEPGRGTIFTFTMPLREAGAQLARAATSLRAAVAHRILLAEDNETNRELIAAVLGQAGHEVVSVADGAAACEAARERHFDVILMDVQMPVTDGYAATRAIRAQGANQRTPIIALTANTLPEEAARCRKAGMDRHVAKPVEWPRLFALMDELVPDSRAGGGVLDITVIERLRGLIGAQNVANLLRMFELEGREQFFAEPETPEQLTAIAREAHSFGGSAAMLGFTELAAACRVLQSAPFADAAGALQACRTARDRALAEAARISAEVAASAVA